MATSHRQSQVPEDPLTSHRRHAVRHGKTSIAVNIPSDARDIFDIERGSMLRVEVYSWGIVVQPINTDDLLKEDSK
ncbi:hypothetical protein [Natrarchaeobaculum sulfurireducens]|uniref:Uncharacterized protein n=1 Tax=Natrarchaeobaculum sulfurireducens TaxID=2044521 RepID=A0A346PMF6_9EURY|nr:hypothetical protein [Natrarchaeobaculum sulfurireducens]AXR80701.1 hypothetical protein AArcMg_0679 [Natrarchaeobaculum sulfurireducens]